MATPGMSAPWFPVPDNPVVSVEHPCFVKNAGKAIDMLGGPSQISRVLEDNVKTTLALSFRPHDPISRTVISFNNKTSNVLVKVIVPKRTGRKRKRGSAEPYMEDLGEPEPRKDAHFFLRSLAENASEYDVQPIGDIQSTHVWRTMPDLVYSASGSQFLNDVQSKILPQEYSLLKRWSFSRDSGLANTEAVPPPVFSTVGLPQNYTYRQNPAVKAVADPSTGKTSLHNSQAAAKVHTHQCQYDTEPVPLNPTPECPPLADQPDALKDLVGIMTSLFQERPIWTRRALINRLPGDAALFLARYAIAYVAYAIRSGPWRDTYCAFGVDPRTDVKYRKMQTILLQLLPKEKDGRDVVYHSWTRGRDPTSHFFTGERVAPDGKVWQLCDLVDPQMKALVDISDVYIRSECERRYFGWYPNGTNAKIRIALKAKVDGLREGRKIDDDALARFLMLPEDWDGQAAPAKDGQPVDPITAYLPKNATKKELEWSSAYRSMCRTPFGTAPISGGSGKGRLSKSKPSARASLLDQTASSDGPGTLVNEAGQSPSNDPTPVGSQVDDADGDRRTMDSILEYDEHEESEEDEFAVLTDTGADQPLL